MCRSVARVAGVFVAFFVLLSVMGGASAAIATGPLYDHEPGHVGNETNATNETAAANETVGDAAPGGSTGPSVGGGGVTDSGNTTTPSSNETSPSEPTNETANESGNASAGSGGGGDGGGILSGITSRAPSFDPAESLISMVEGAWEDIRPGAAAFIDEFNFIFTGVPAPGEPGSIESWISPPEPEWEVARNLYLTMVALMTPFLVANFMQALGTDDHQRREEMIKDNIITLAMYPAGWIIIAALTHATNAWTGALTPSGEEFLAAPESIGQLGVGILLGAGLAKVNVVILIIGIILIMLVWFLILFVASTWPGWWTMRSSGFPMMRTWGNYMITTFLIVLLVRGTQALGLRFLFHLPFGEVGPGSTLVYLVATIIGLWFLLYKLLRVAIEKTAAASAFTLGMSYLPAQYSASDAVSDGKQQAKQKYKGAKSTASTVKHAPSKVRNAPSATRQRISSRVPDRLSRGSNDASGSTKPSPTYSGGPEMEMRATRPTPTGSRSAPSRMVRSDGGSRSTSGNSKTVGSGKPRKRLKKTDDGYTVVDT